MGEDFQMEVYEPKLADKWFAVDRYEIHGSGWATWHVAKLTGLVSPDHWRLKDTTGFGYMCGRGGCQRLEPRHPSPRLVH